MVLAPYQHSATSRPQLSFVEANRQSLVAVAFAVGYLVLASGRTLSSLPPVGGDVILLTEIDDYAATAQ